LSRVIEKEKRKKRGQVNVIIYAYLPITIDYTFHNTSANFYEKSLED
jgi:hypothetical protein